MADVLRYHESRGRRVLDVGSGQGIDLARYALAGALVTGVDLTTRHVELAKAHLAALGLEGHIVQGDAEALPFPDGRFDRVSSNGVLHHTPDMRAAVREIFRVLRPGGEAVIIVYNSRSLHYWLTQVLWRGIIRGGLVRERSMAGVLSSGVEFSRSGGRPLVRVYSVAQVRAMMAAAGFQGVVTFKRHFNISDTPVTYVLGKRIRAMRSPWLLDRLGHLAGWYVVGVGKRPER